ncbi:MAG: TolB family protein, partial [Terriglobales bacterium]
FVYFVTGALPDQLRIVRVPPTCGVPEQLTQIPGRITYPLLLDSQQLLFLAADPDGSGPWLFGMDLARRVPHRLSAAPDRFTSLAASSDPRRLVATLARTTTTLWSMPLSPPSLAVANPVRIPLTSATARWPRAGPDYVLYVSSVGKNGSIWRVSNGASRQVWTLADAQILGAPAISPGGSRVAFAVRRNARSSLYVMSPDGSRQRLVSDLLPWQGSPAWAPGGQSLTVAALVAGVPRLFRVPLQGGPPVPLTRQFALDPAWAPGGGFLLYSGADIGTAFSLHALGNQNHELPLRPLALPRGARHVVFLPGSSQLVALRGAIHHKDLWRIDLLTGAALRLTRFPPDFDVEDFDITPDGRRLVLAREEDRSDVVLLNLAPH